MFSILNRALSWAITSFGNKFYLRKRSRLVKALDNMFYNSNSNTLDNMFYVKFMQLEIGLLGSGNSRSESYRMFSSFAEKKNLVLK